MEHEVDLDAYHGSDIPSIKEIHTNEEEAKRRIIQLSENYANSFTYQDDRLYCVIVQENQKSIAVYYVMDRYMLDEIPMYKLTLKEIKECIENFYGDIKRFEIEVHELMEP